MASNFFEIGQNKVKHIYFTNRKEYYRRKRISASLKKYHASKTKIKAEIKGVFKLIRYRTQVVYNTDYNISFRAVEINGTRTIETLKKMLRYWMSTNKELKPLKTMYFRHSAVEAEEFQQEIDSTEDANLKVGVVHFEAFVRGKIIRGVA